MNQVIGPEFANASTDLRDNLSVIFQFFQGLIVKVITPAVQAFAFLTTQIREFLGLAAQAPVAPPTGPTLSLQGRNDADRANERQREREHQELLAKDRLLIAQQTLDEEIRGRVRAGEDLDRLAAERRDREAGLELQHAQDVHQIAIRFTKEGTNERIQADLTFREAFLQHEQGTTAVVVAETAERIAADDKWATERERGLERARQKADREFQQQLDNEARARKQALATEQRAMERFADQVAQTLSQVFLGLLEGTLSAVEFFKRLFLQAIADLAARVAATQVILPITAGIIGGITEQSLGSLLAPGAMFASLFGPESLLGRGVSALGGALTSAADTVGSFFGQPAGAVSPFGLFGGAAAVGGGLFAAITAQNVVSMGLASAGAAAGIASLLGTLNLLPSILGPAGLALSAVLTIASQFISLAPKGPRLEFGRAEGAQAVLGPDAEIVLEGEIVVPITRAERVGGDVEIQQALQAGLTQIATNMITMINTVALDSSLLVDETNAAIQQAFQDLHQIQTSSRRNFARDIEDQMALIFTQFTVAFLSPLTSAFAQLETATLQEQIQRLPQTTAVMVQTQASTKPLRS